MLCSPPTGEHTQHNVPDPAIATTWAGIIRKTLGWGPPEERDTRD